MSTSGSVTSDVSNIFNPKATAGRKVSADLSGTEVKTTIESEGNKKLFDAGSKQLGKQDFLQLLVTQMRFQDPMAPQDNQQFVAQLAQFSALEGTQNISTSVDELGKKMETLLGAKTTASTVDPSAATSLIGKSVRVSASDIIFDPSQKDPVEINVHADAGADSVLTILDSDEKIVNLLPLTAGGEAKIKWNGLKAGGGTAVAGKYHLKVTSTDGKSNTGYTFFEDKVTGIGYGKTGARVEVKGQSIALDQILHVGETAK